MHPQYPGQFLFFLARWIEHIPACLHLTTVDSDKRQLAASNVKAAEAVIEFFQKLGFKDIIVAESSAGNTMKAYKNFDYFQLEKKYGVKLVDMNKEPSAKINVGTIVPVSKIMLDKHNFIISLAMPKTHDCVIATLSLKNILERTWDLF